MAPIFFLLFAIALVAPVVWTSLDLYASGLFYRAGGDGFFMATNPVLIFLHWLAYYGARILGLAFAFLTLATWLWRRHIFGIDSKAWLFLFLALVIGPGLVANAAFKDHWGRARPREVVEFGGQAPFTPALMPQFQNAHSNGSFVSGDAAFGFFLPAFAYVVPRRSSRHIFWAAMGAGSLFGLVRLVMGAHFFSDIVYAAFMMLVVVAAVHAMFYGRRLTLSLWRFWLSTS